MKKLALVALLLSTAAYAEDKPTADSSGNPPAVSSQPTPAVTVPEFYYLEVNQDDLNAISAGINELPKRVADKLLTKLVAQIQDQKGVKARASK